LTPLWEKAEKNLKAKIYKALQEMLDIAAPRTLITKPGEINTLLKTSYSITSRKSIS